MVVYIEVSSYNRWLFILKYQVSPTLYQRYNFSLSLKVLLILLKKVWADILPIPFFGHNNSKFSIPILLVLLILYIGLPILFFFIILVLMVCRHPLLLNVFYFAGKIFTSLRTRLNSKYFEITMFLRVSK